MDRVKSIRKRFGSDVNREVVRLLEQGDKGSSQLARKLGVRPNPLYKWKAEEALRFAKALGIGEGVL